MIQFIGLDVHRKMTVACIYNPRTKEERYQTIATDEDQLATFLKDQPTTSRVAFEVNGMAGPKPPASSPPESTGRKK